MAKGKLTTILGYLRRVVGDAPDREFSDGQMLERFASEGDEAAFTILVQRHGPMVLEVCLRLLGDSHDAEDAFQATFLVLARKASSIRKRDSVASWLHGVALRVARKMRTDGARRRSQEKQVEIMAQADLVDEVARRELRPVLDEELNRLPEHYRTPVILCYLEGKTNEQAAQELGWPKGTVSGRLARARELLRGRLTRRGLALPAGVLATLLNESSASAAVPVALLDSTVKAATVFAAGNTLAAGVSSSAGALAEGVMKTMFLTKIKITLAVLLVLGVFGAGTGYLTQNGPGDKPGAKANAAPTGNEPQDSRSDDDPAKLKEEIERLKRELRKAQLQIELLREEALKQRDLAQQQAKVAEEQRRRAEAARAEAEEAFKRAVDQQKRALEAEQQARAAAQRAIGANHLKHLGIALHSYHDVHNRFPASAIYSKDGKPLLSWRVAILPFLEQDELYKQFKLDEPWDSEHNKKLLAKMPSVFAAPGTKSHEQHETHYQGFVGKGCTFEGKKGVRLLDVPDGLSNTVLVVEASSSVPWTKPEGLSYAANKPLPRMGATGGDFYILLGDGSVRKVKQKFNEKTFRLAIQRNDNQPFEFTDLDP